MTKDKKRRGQRRMIHAAISSSKRFNRLPTDQARLLWCLIMAHTDDFGHIESEIQDIKGKIVPRLDWTSDQLQEYFLSLVDAKMITCYMAEGNLYAEVVLFDEHQAFPRGREAQYPMPGEYLNIEQLLAYLKAV